jgi:Zn ribbon nucleic-acid-binding protein
MTVEEVERMMDKITATIAISSGLAVLGGLLGGAFVAVVGFGLGIAVNLSRFRNKELPCPECGSREWNALPPEHWPGLIECSDCGHPRTRIGAKLKFESAPDDQVEELREKVDKVLVAMGFDPSEVFITDESMVGDFEYIRDDDDKVVPNPELPEKVQKALGVPVSSMDYVVDVARRLP